MAGSVVSILHALTNLILQTILISRRHYHLHHFLHGKSKAQRNQSFFPARTTGRGRDYQDLMSPASLWVPLMRGGGGRSSHLSPSPSPSTQPSLPVLRSVLPSDPFRNPSAPTPAALTAPSLSAAPTGPGLLEDSDGPCFSLQLQHRARPLTPGPCWKTHQNVQATYQRAVFTPNKSPVISSLA